MTIISFSRDLLDCHEKSVAYLSLLK